MSDQQRAGWRWTRPTRNLLVYAVVLWAAYSGGWWGVFMASTICASDFTAERLIYWNRRLEETKRKQVPDGMISIVLADGTPVYVPPTPELIEAVREIVAIVEGTNG